jgi:glycosyltransferase involved in cell wall biosynthesis
LLVACLKVLFVAEQKSCDDSADIRRLMVLKNGLENCGVQTQVLWLGDYLISTPRILQIINIPRFLRLTTEYSIVHTAGVSSVVMAIAKLLNNFTMLCDIQGSLKENSFLKQNALDLKSYYSVLQTVISLPLILKQTDYFTSCSQRLERDLLRKGIDKEKICVIRNGVDTEIFKPSKKKSKTNTFTITYAGGFHKYQGMENLLGAIQLLKDADVRFKIIGFRQTDFALKERIRDNFGNKVELVDFLTQKELVFQLQTSDAFIIPRAKNLATEPAFPTKFAEYLAIGKPIIVTNVDETAELVSEYDCGFVCNPNADSIAKAVVEAKETPSERMNQMGENGRHLAETHFSQKVLGKAYYRFLLKIRKVGSN